MNTTNVEGAESIIPCPVPPNCANVVCTLTNTDCSTKVIGAVPTVLEGRFYVMTTFEKGLAVGQDRTTIAAFLSFLFVIPGTFLALYFSLKRRRW